MKYIKEFISNYKLIIYLSKNDFRKKFAGSYLGIIWAFVQPLVTIVLYWFVFEKGLRSEGVSDVPFVLWLMAGLVPWFFFSEAIVNASNCFFEYSYLVKKVVFNINILPIVKAISSLFVHLFFIFVLVVVYAISGRFPGIVIIQLGYYSFCMLILALGFSYFFSAVAVFFKDTTQIVSILMQIGVWMTPIMWNMDTMDLSATLIRVFKLNPMYYVVSGYRDTLINGYSFWNRPNLTIYFWVVTFVVFIIGSVVYKRLKPHFSDAL